MDNFPDRLPMFMCLMRSEHLKIPKKFFGVFRANQQIFKLIQPNFRWFNLILFDLNKYHRLFDKMVWLDYFNFFSNGRLIQPSDKFQINLSHVKSYGILSGTYQKGD